MHLSLSSTNGTMHGHFSKIPLPANTHLWDWCGDLNSPSRRFSADGVHQREACSPNASDIQFSAEIQLQIMLIRCTTPAMDGLNPSGELPNSLHPPGFSLNTLHPGTALDALSQPTSQHIDDAVCRAKYHMYEVSIYWPVIYSIIIHGSADPELLPYAPLFFQSVTSFLGSASLALRVYLPKAWFLCAKYVLRLLLSYLCGGVCLQTMFSIYVACNAAMRAVEVRGLRLLCQPQFWEQIDTSLDAMHQPSMLSPAVQYMRNSLKVRLEETKIQQKV